MLIKMLHMDLCRLGKHVQRVPLVAPTDYDVDYQLRIIAKSEPDMVEFRADTFLKSATNLAK